MLQKVFADFGAVGGVSEFVCVFGFSTQIGGLAGVPGDTGFFEVLKSRA